MIIVRLQGGLGNQMFQYAMGRSLQLRKRGEVVFDNTQFHLSPGRQYQLDKFDLPHLKLTKNGGRGNPTILKEKKYFTFDPEIYSLEDDKRYVLEGSWQNPEYFQGIWQIRDELKSLKEKPSPMFRHYAGILASTVNPVAIHVRCGDFYNKKTAKFHGNLPKDYYEKALYRITEGTGILKPKFYVFSDDIKKACEVLPQSQWYKYQFIDDIVPDYEQILLMALCKHFIVANSSFSWWGAYLSNNQDKLVIAPEKWIVPRHHVGIHPDNWLQIGGYV